MKFDVLKWSEIELGREYTPPRGRVHIMASKPVAVYVSAFGVEALAGVAHEVDVTIDGDVTYRVEGEPETRVFVEAPQARSQRSRGEVFTNADRLPQESGTMLEVQRELRRFYLERRGLRAEMAREREALERLRRQPEPAPEPEPEPAPEPAPEPEGEGAAE